MKTIKVLGTGCPNCVRLENNVKLALEKSGIEAKVEKVTDIGKIMAYGVMGTPGFVIDEKVISAGKVLEVDEIISLLDGKKEEKTSCCSGKNTSCCSPEKEEIKKESSCCSSPKKEEKSSCCSSDKKDESKSGESCGKDGCKEKLESAVRILFITSMMTGLFTYLHDGNIINWLGNWGMMFVIVLSTMCFIIRPFIIMPISKKIGQKKGKLIGMMLLVFIMSILFTYRFNGFDENITINIVKNFGILLITAIPSVFIIINPILKLIFKK